MSATCPYCRTTIEAEDEVLSCSGCNTVHHAACFAENGGCTVFGCSSAPADEPKISVLPQDLSAPPVIEEPRATHWRPQSILNLETPPLRDGPVGPAVLPPPPTEGSGVPPPPPPPSSLTTSPSPIFVAYGPPIPPLRSDYLPRKNRVVFVLLAVFLGAFGGHNFYAGYVKRAVIQLCITVFTCFFGSIISWIWAIVEACIVDHDDDGVAFV
jgi:TM2 domain-containing membrane protein YozV